MSTSTQAPLGQMYEVNGRELFLHRSGAGGPAVVFLPGASAFGLDYLNIHERVAEFTTSVLYDRGGTGWSDPVDLPRTAAEVGEELRALLWVADVSRALPVRRSFARGSICASLCADVSR